MAQEPLGLRFSQFKMLFVGPMLFFGMLEVDSLIFKDQKTLYVQDSYLPPKWKAVGVLCFLFLGQDGDSEDLLPSSSFSTLLDPQVFSDLEKNLSLTPVRGSPSHDPFNTSAPEEVFTALLFLHVKETLSLKVKVPLTTSKTWVLFWVGSLTCFLLAVIMTSGSLFEASSPPPSLINKGLGHLQQHEWTRRVSYWVKSVRQRRRSITWHPLCVESKEKWYKWSYLQNRNRLTDLEKKLMVARGKDQGKDN